MGKVIEKVKITNVLEPSKSIEIDALIDIGATMVVLPQDIVPKPLQTSYVHKPSYEIAFKGD